MSRTENILELMEAGFGVREAIFVATGILPRDIAEASRDDYAEDVLAAVHASRADSSLLI